MILRSAAFAAAFAAFAGLSGAPALAGCDLTDPACTASEKPKADSEPKAAADKLAND